MKWLALAMSSAAALMVGWLIQYRQTVRRRDEYRRKMRTGH